MTVAAAESSQPEIATVVRTLRFEVVWPGWRQADLSALWQELWRAQGDLRRAANLSASALCQLRLGTIPRPVKEDGVTPVSDQTLSYQLLSGKWQPFGSPCYQPSPDTRRVSSQVLLDLASTIHTRIKTDWAEIRRGDRSLPTWKQVPVGSTGPGVAVDPELGTVTIGLWEGRGQRVTLRPRKLDPRAWADFRRAVKYGSAKLQWDQPPGRKGRWMLSLALELPAATREAPPLLCAVRLGMTTTCTLAYAEPTQGKVLRQGDQIDLPASAWRAVQRIESERTERTRWNRKDRGAREGHGRTRKLRVVADLGDVVARVTETAVRQTAAAVVRTAIRRGATILALPDLSGWSVAAELDRTEDLSQGDRAAHRRWYFRWHQGALRQQLRQAAEREGLEIREVPVGGSSATCSECGVENPAHRAAGRWECSCGCKLPVEVNTARVLARRGVQAAKP
jgi:hypothetical protein